MRLSDGPMGGDADRGAPFRSAARSSSPPPIARSVQSASCGVLLAGNLQPPGARARGCTHHPGCEIGSADHHLGDQGGSAYNPTTWFAKRANSLYESGRAAVPDIIVGAAGVNSWIS
jgi:hypothetical protein